MSQAHDYSDANREYFNNEAHKYDDRPVALELARKIGGVILKTLNFDEEKTAVLDYACGTGLIARELAPHAKVIVGVDISQGMVDQFNLRVANQGIPADEMRAVCLELQGREDELDGQKFDVVVCAQAYHHFTSIEDVTCILAYFLKPGGALIVSDIVKSTHDPFTHAHHVHHVVAHKGGFEEEQIRLAFEQAKLERFSFRPAVSVTMNEQAVSLFIAIGFKSPARSE